MVRHKLTVVNNPFETGDRMVLDGVIPSKRVRLSPKEPRDRAARSEFQSEIPQIVWCDPTDSSHRYGRGSQRARWGMAPVQTGFEVPSNKKGPTFLPALPGPLRAGVLANVTSRSDTAWICGGGGALRVGVHANSGRVSDAYGAFPEGRGNRGWGHTEQAGSTLAGQ